MKIIGRIRGGGQPGGSRAAFDAARDASVPICGWCPKGGRSPDFDEPPGILLDYPELQETPMSESGQMVEWNVRDSHATLVLGTGELDGETSFAMGVAEFYGRPLFIAGGRSPESVYGEISRYGIGLTLNVVGCDADLEFGGYEEFFRFMSALLRIDASREMELPFSVSTIAKIEIDTTNIRIGNVGDEGRTKPLGTYPERFNRRYRSKKR